MMYYEHVVDYLDRYGTLTKIAIFSEGGEKLFSLPDDVEFARPHLLAVLKCMADCLHPLAGVNVGSNVYRCLRVDDGLLVGRSDTEEFVAYKTEDAVIVGFTDRERSADCCLTDVKNVERELHRPPTLLDTELGPPGYEETEDTADQFTESVEQPTVVSQTNARPTVRFQDARNEQVREAEKAMGESRTDSDDREFVMVKLDEQGMSLSDDEGDGTFENVALEIGDSDYQAPRVTAEDVELDIIDRTGGF